MASSREFARVDLNSENFPTPNNARLEEVFFIKVVSINIA